jgi:hypothetical protein
MLKNQIIISGTHHRADKEVQHAAQNGLCGQPKHFPKGHHNTTELLEDMH